MNVTCANFSPNYITSLLSNKRMNIVDNFRFITQGEKTASERSFNRGRQTCVTCFFTTSDQVFIYFKIDRNANHVSRTKSYY